MRTFKDLKFKKHPKGDGLQSTIFFENGYGVSVGRYVTYTNNDSEKREAISRL